MNYFKIKKKYQEIKFSMKNLMLKTKNTLKNFNIKYSKG